MKTSEQGVEQGKLRRYSVIPRTLIFVTSRNPETGELDVLLIKGAPTKRLWANKYNGVGGHVEAAEDVLSAARRELAEETGLQRVDLVSRGVINIAVEPGGTDPGGVAVFLFQGHTDERDVRPGAEGDLVWLPVKRLDDYPLVDDLYQLLPLLLEQDGAVYGHYTPNADGTLAYRFSVARQSSISTQAG